MSTRALLLTAILLAAAAAAPAQAVATRRPRCGWGTVKDVSDPHIQELGSWAVAEHVRRANDGLRFGKVMSAQVKIVAGMSYHKLSAQVQAVAGMSYKLYLDAADAGGDVAAYGAVVYEHEQTSTRKLTSFARAGEMARNVTGRCLQE